MYDILIKNGLVFDGTGSKGFISDIAIAKGKIIEIGQLRHLRAKTEINAEGNYVSPGFIDINNDADHYLSIFELPHFENLIRQGVTTIVCGNCGASLAPLIRGSLVSIQKWVNPSSFNVNWQTFDEFLNFLSRKGLGVNFLSLIGWATLRRDLAGEEFRPLKDFELKKLIRVVEKSLKEGAFGVSFGLGYSHERMVGLKEIEAVAEIVKKYQGYIAVHLRDESAKFLEALDEIIEAAKATAVSFEISHLKIIGTPYWDKFDDGLEKIHQAFMDGINISFDVYPYDINAQVLYLILPEWLTIGGKKALIKNLKDPVLRKKALEDLKKNRHLYEKLIIADPGGQWILAAKSLEEIAENEGRSLEETLLRLLEITNDRVIVFSPNISETNMIKALKAKESIISSNSAAYNLASSRKGILVHPRAFGTFPRFLGHYVRGQKILSFEEAIHKITGKPALKIGLKDRGFIKKNYWADVVIFNPEKIIDKATLKSPFQYPEGIETVIINGSIAYHRGLMEKKLLGQIIRRE